MLTSAVLIPAALAAVTVLSQITWVLVSGAARDALTITGVVAFFGSSLSHALVTRGMAWSVWFFAVALVFGWAVEALGTTTGFPFGAYTYGDRLGWALGAVPLLIPLAWAMMAYPCFVLTARAARSRLGLVVLAAVLLATWDLFLDPQMVSEGHWTFADPDPALPGVPDTPLGNYVGWLAAALVLMALLVAVTRPALPDPTGQLGVPGVLLGWVYCSNVLANLAFWGRPAVALFGGIAMGVPLVVLALRTRAVPDPAPHPSGPVHAR